MYIREIIFIIIIIIILIIGKKKENYTCYNIENYIIYIHIYMCVYCIHDYMHIMTAQWSDV